MAKDLKENELQVGDLVVLFARIREMYDDSVSIEPEHGSEQHGLICPTITVSSILIQKGGYGSPDEFI